MSESPDASVPNEDDVWQYIKDHPRILGLPVSDKQGLDLLNALRDVAEMIHQDQEMAHKMLTMIATVIVAAAAGEGNETIEELLVAEAMHNFEKETKEILSEKPE
jgi:predicted lipid-binding transport protein (Tim44 family)